MSPGVPYVSVRSNDVLNGSLDLVLRLCTRVDTVWRVLRPGREVGIFLLDPLLVGTVICSRQLFLLGNNTLSYRTMSPIRSPLLSPVALGLGPGEGGCTGAMVV